MEVRKGHARHSLRGRICGEELYDIGGRYHTPFKTFSEALEVLKTGLRSHIVHIQERLQELEAMEE